MSLADRIVRRDRKRKQNQRAREIVGSDAVTLEAPGSLLDFIPKISSGLERPDHLAPLADAFERGAAQCGAVQECHSVPVRHGKTTLIHHAIPYLFRHDPTRAILYASYAHGFAKKQTSKAKALARRAGVRLSRGRRVDEWSTRDGGFVKAAGIGGQITGEGFTDIIVDDPHKNRAEAESRVIREGVIEAFFNDIFTRQDPRGTNVYVVHARWHVNDLIGVLSTMGEGAFAYVNLPALDAEGRALAPMLFTAEHLRRMRSTLGPYVWASLYQGSPRRRGGNLFSDGPTLARLEEPATYRVAIGIDLARKGSDRQDYNAAVVMRKDLGAGWLDVLEAVRERGSVTDRRRGDELVDAGFTRELVRLLHEHPGAELVMYAVEQEAAFVKVLETDLRELLGYEIRVRVIPIAGDKYLRAQPYAASWNKGRMRLAGRASVAEGHEDDGGMAPAHHGWQGPFVVEHVEFTGQKGNADDMVDAGAAAHDHLQEAKGTTLVEAMEAIGRI